jgi:hypothetical protein
MNAVRRQLLIIMALTLMAGNTRADGLCSIERVRVGGIKQSVLRADLVSHHAAAVSLRASS